MYMSIATLARKSRAQRGASTRTGWTLATNANGGGRCHGPCNGIAPAKQKSFRLVMKERQGGGGPAPGGLMSNKCCHTTYKEVIDPEGNQSAGGYIWKKKQRSQDCLYTCVDGQEEYRDSTGNTHIVGSCSSPACNNTGCRCNCNKSMGGTTCCVIHKTMLPRSNSENLPWIVKTRTCLQKEKAAPTNPHNC